jgi:hypothetical protein
MMELQTYLAVHFFVRLSSLKLNAIDKSVVIGA